ncbi:MAG: aminoglycoside phosphotransferase family protein [Ilumatobacteraceae bacterium]
MALLDDGRTLVMAAERVDRRPFVDVPVDDVQAATRLAGRAARHWGLDGPVELERVGMNAVFSAGAVVVRVGRPNAPATAALELARRLIEVGLRVPEPAAADPVVDPESAMTATLWERVRPSGDAIDWRGVGESVARLHAAGSALVPDDHPCPSPTTFPWWDFDTLLDDVGDIVDRTALERLAATVERHRWWRDAVTEGAVVCHGDVHPGNVVPTSDGPVLLDWDLLCIAPPGWDHGPMMTWAERWGGVPGEYEAYAAGYGWSGRGDPFAEAVAELRLVAATLMRVRAARTDPAARSEAERRLAFWRGDRDAPAWRAQ